MNKGEHVVYILFSCRRKKWSYVGSTSNFEQRLKDHQSGRVRSTKPYRPLSVVHTEIWPDREAAYRRELYLKSGMGREEKNNIVKHSGIV